MPKKAAGLTMQDIERKPSGLWADGGGLYLRVTASGNRAWVFRYQLDGKRHDMGLGPVEPGNGLREARGAVYERRAQVRQGIDPLAAKATAKAERVAATAAAFTFAEVAEQYIVAHEAEWRSHKSLAETR
jgi:Arm domain-containing DNA-binding protein